MSVDLSKKWLGAVGVFLGVQTQGWTIAQFQAAAEWARDNGVDTLYVKTADGGNIWYGGLSGFKAIHDAIIAKGVGCAPYVYSYGDKFGALKDEINIMQKLMQAYGGVIGDLEVEYNGRTDWAATLNAALRPVPGYFFLSTWADPAQQDWIGVLNALAPCVNVVMPQQYNNYLASQYATLGNLPQMPTVLIGQDFGPNDPVAIAKAARAHGDAAISIWEYQPATANNQIVHSIVQLFKPVASQPVGGTKPVANAEDQAMLDTWHASLVPQDKLNYNSGIAGAWRAEYRAGKQYGPPSSSEYHSVDWGGTPIVIQEFPGGRCEWRNGNPSWIKRP